jgi:hypothetical protein
VAINLQGNAVAVWGATVSSSAMPIVQAAIRPIDSAWQPATELSETRKPESYPQVANGPRGEAIAVWWGVHEGNDVIESSVRPAASASWQAPVALSGAIPQASKPAIAMDSVGNAVAAWAVGNDIQAAGYDVGPMLSVLAIPPAGIVGQALTFSVSPLAVWSALEETSWSFGDGTSANGAGVTHIYTAPGIYPVSVTSVDALGNATSTLVTITITPTMPLTFPPLIGRVTQAHRTWREGNRLASIARKHKPPLGTTFSFMLNEQASVSFVFTPKMDRRKAENRCVMSTTKNRKKHSCRRTVIHNTFSVVGHAGTNNVSFQGRVSRSQKLKPGHYTLVIMATNDAGQRSRPHSLSFTIVK